MYVTRISLGLMINADVLSVSSRRLIFGGSVTALGFKSLFAVKTELMNQFSVRNIDVLMNVQSPHKWWSTLKSDVFG